LTVAAIVVPLFVEVKSASFEAKPRYLPQRSLSAVLPESIQGTTTFSGGVARVSTQPDRVV
jgi:hypothetical protein